MDWLHSFRPTDYPAFTEPGLPKRMLRHLVRIGKITVGSKVLDAGCGRGELTRFLDELSIEASGIDEKLESVACAQKAATHLSYACCQASISVPFPEQHFNVVLARDLPEYGCDLFGHRALRATAHLLATLRPEGCLILMSRLDPLWSTRPGGHTQACFLKHLQCFPGLCQVSCLADSLMETTTWNWMMGRKPRAGYITAVLTISQTLRSCREWEQIADQVFQNHRQTCCGWCENTGDSQRPSRIAA